MNIFRKYFSLFSILAIVFISFGTTLFFPRTTDATTTTVVLTSSGSWVVPSGVSSISVKAWGGGGGGGGNGGSGASGGAGGGGGYALSTLAVTPGETLTIDIGGGGGASPSGCVGPASGGTAGAGTTGPGGHGGNLTISCSGPGGGGGGGTFVLRNATILIAAGGGGGGGGTEASGGAGAGGGGGANGANGANGATGGTAGGNTGSSAGQAGATPGVDESAAGGGGGGLVGGTAGGLPGVDAVGAAGGGGGSNSGNVTTSNGSGTTPGNSSDSNLSTYAVGGAAQTAGTQGLVVITYNPRVTLVKPGNNLGLVGFWRFEDGTSTLATDFSGNRNTATLSTTGSVLPTWTTGKLGKALSFDGSTNYAVINSASSLTWTAGQNFSVATWMKVASHNATYREILRKGDTVDAWLLLLNAANKIALSTSGVAGEYDNGYPYPADNQWHYVTATYNGTTVVIYLDGVSVASYAGAGPSTNTDGIAMGRLGSTGAGSQYFTGSLDEVRIYNRALGAAEVAGLYKSGAVKFTTNSRVLSQGTSLSAGLTGLWTFDGADMNWTGDTSGTAYDRSGNGFDGTLTNMNRRVAVDGGKLGQALTFDGAATHILTGKPLSSFVTATDATIAVWVKPTGTATVAATSYNGMGAISDTSAYIGIYRTNITGADRLWAYNWDGGEEKVGVSYNANEWTHIVLVHTGGVLYIYKNGVLGGSITSGNTQNLTFNVWLGRGYNTAAAYWLGSLDDIRTYNRALSATEIQQLYNLGTAKIK